MTERTETITEREYTSDGKLIKETVTTIVEKDDGVQHYPINGPYWTSDTVMINTSADQKRYSDTITAAM